MSIAIPISRVLNRFNSLKLIYHKNFATGRKVSKTIKGVRSTLPKVTIPPPPSSVPLEDAWVEVIDKSSGLKYFWNTITNETTELGAPKPKDTTAITEENKGGSMMGGLGRVVAEGFAFGVGSSVAHGIVGSMFGSGSSHSSGTESTSDSSSDEWDI